MTSRLLPPEEWPRLGPESFWRDLPPASRVMVVEQDGAIRGRWVLMPIWHAEFLQSDGTAVSRRLYRDMRRITRELDVRAVYTGAEDDTVRGLLDHVGAKKLGGDHYIWDINGAAVCP